MKNLALTGLIMLFMSLNSINAQTWNFPEFLPSPNNTPISTIIRIPETITTNLPTCPSATVGRNNEPAFSMRYPSSPGKIYTRGEEILLKWWHWYGNEWIGQDKAEKYKWTIKDAATGALMKGGTHSPICPSCSPLNYIKWTIPACGPDAIYIFEVTAYDKEGSNYQCTIGTAFIASGLLQPPLPQAHLVCSSGKKWLFIPNPQDAEELRIYDNVNSISPKKILSPSNSNGASFFIYKLDVNSNLNSNRTFWASYKKKICDSTPFETAKVPMTVMALNVITEGVAVEEQAIIVKPPNYDSNNPSCNLAANIGSYYILEDIEVAPMQDGLQLTMSEYISDLTGGEVYDLKAIVHDPKWSRPYTYDNNVKRVCWNDLPPGPVSSNTYYYTGKVEYTYKYKDPARGDAENTGVGSCQVVFRKVTVTKAMGIPPVIVKTSCEPFMTLDPRDYSGFDDEVQSILWEDKNVPSYIIEGITYKNYDILSTFTYQKEFSYVDWNETLEKKRHYTGTYQYEHNGIKSATSAFQILVLPSPEEVNQNLYGTLPIQSTEYVTEPLIPSNPSDPRFYCNQPNSYYTLSPVADDYISAINYALDAFNLLTGISITSSKVELIWVDENGFPPYRYTSDDPLNGAIDEYRACWEDLNEGCKTYYGRVRAYFEIATNLGGLTGTPATPVICSYDIFAVTVCRGLPIDGGKNPLGKISEGSTIQIFPNPANSSIHINNTDDLDEVIITDMYGQLLYQSKQALNTIDVSKFSNGSIIVNLLNNQSLIKRQIIQIIK